MMHNLDFDENFREIFKDKSNNNFDFDFESGKITYDYYNNSILKTGNTILQIHHIDGNSKNNSPDNLQVICPNCHAKTENYMALNKGNSGRDKRYKK